MRSGSRPREYYQTLGIDPQATPDEIRRAYRKLALEWHPDRNPGNPDATKRFQEISEAYAVLIDPQKRSEYDELRAIGSAARFGYSRDDLFRDMFSNPSASAIFEEIAREFERMGVRVDRHYFEQTLFGGRAYVSGAVFVISPFTPFVGLFQLARLALRGAGAAAGVATRQAEQLPGVGGVVSGMGRVGRWLLGIPAEPVSGEPLASTGDISIPLRLTREESEAGARKPVSVPHGGKSEKLLVLVPRGVRQGSRLRIRGKGRATPSGTPGDLYLLIEIPQPPPGTHQ
jgi:curved DNA-binding protein CbpA